MQRKIYISFLFFLCAFHFSYGQYLIKLSDEDGRPVEYAVVTIKEMNRTFISNEKGEIHLKTDLAFNKFTFEINALRIQDTIITIPVENNIVKIVLKEQRFLLPEFYVDYENKWELKKVGPKSLFATLPMTHRPSDTLIKVATLFENNKKIVLKEIKIHIRNLQTDTFYIGFNIMSQDANGLPGKNILSSDIVVPIVEKGWYSLDISDYNLVLNENYFLSYTKYSDIYSEDIDSKIYIPNISVSVKIFRASKAWYKYPNSTKWNYFAAKPMINSIFMEKKLD